MWVALAGLPVGFLLVYWIKAPIPVHYGDYVSVAVLAALDAIVAGLRASQENRFAAPTFLVGFFSNVAGAALLVYLGTVLGLNLMLAIAVALVLRLFGNLSAIGRYVAQRFLPVEESELDPASANAV